MKIRWVLLDRDGTINVKAPDGDYITMPERLRLLDGAADAIRRLNEAKLPIVVVTNQRAIALRLMTLKDLAHVHEALHDQLGRHGASVAAILSCPHERDSCTCRKPKIGLLRQAARHVGLPLIDAVVIGDSEIDVVAGARAGTTTIRIAESAIDTVADFIAPSLLSAVDLVVDARAR